MRHWTQQLGKGKENTNNLGDLHHPFTSSKGKEGAQIQNGLQNRHEKLHIDSALMFPVLGN